jgi:hypothetical protein
LATVLATNKTIEFLDGGSAGTGREFYRAVTLP